MGVIFLNFNFIVGFMSLVSYLRAFVQRNGLRRILYKQTHRKIQGKLQGFHAVRKVQKVSETEKERID